ncbi:DUF317 domain-containing protein [Streptomyces sp. NPDC050161]|uniref:DUF317 domain-containing protein n=1 Tax=Streptomyces sp. NPDC050161 TaxID=3365604 RepID=UPI0037A5547D
MPVRERQLAAYAERHATTTPLNTSPRYLAGPGDARHVTHALAEAGWTSPSDPLDPQIRMISPDRRLSLWYDPQTSTSAWWRLRGTSPESGYWYAAFGEMVPAEILAGFTDALIALPPKDAPPGVWEQLAGTGWTCSHHDDGTGQAVSPDDLLLVTQRHCADGSRAVWRVDAFDGPHGRGLLWDAWLEDTAPAPAVAAFVTALIDPGPVLRGKFDRTGAYVTQESSPFVPEQVVEAHVARLKSIRSKARAARRRTLATTPAPTPAVPARSPDSARAR